MGMDLLSPGNGFVTSANCRAPQELSGRFDCVCLERGADPNRAGADGMTFGKMLIDHRAHFGRTLKRPPVEFVTLWDWAEKHGILRQPE